MTLTKDNAEAAYDYVFMDYVSKLNEYISSPTHEGKKSVTTLLFLMKLLKSEFGIGLTSCDSTVLFSKYYDSLMSKLNSTENVPDNISELMAIPK